MSYFTLTQPGCHCQAQTRRWSDAGWTCDKMIRYVISPIRLSERIPCVHCMNITSAHVLILEGPILVTSLYMDIHWLRDPASPGRHFVIDGKYLHRVTITVDSDKDTDGGPAHWHPGTKLMPQKLKRLSSLLTCFHLIFKYLSRAVFIGFQRHKFSPASSCLSSHGLIDPDNTVSNSHWWLETWESVKYGNLLIAPSRSWMSWAITRS